MSSDMENDVEYLTFELMKSQNTIGSAEVEVKDLGSTSEPFCIIFTMLSQGPDDPPATACVNLHSTSVDLKVEERELFESHSMVDSASDEFASGTRSPALGSVADDQISDDGGFVDVIDALYLLPSMDDDSGIASTNSSQLPLGLLDLEVVGAENIPPSRLRLNVGGPQSPFVVLSFGRKSFRTKTIYRNFNPVWNERLFLPVLERESHYHATFALYNQRALAGNVCSGKARLRVAELLQQPDKTFHLSLPIAVAEEDKNPEKPCKLLIRCSFYPMDSVKRIFWQHIAAQYDLDESGNLNLVEFESMMNAIGPNLNDQTLDAIAEALGPYSESGEFSFAVIAGALQFYPLVADPKGDSDGATLVIDHCPLCSKQLPNDLSSDDIIMHVFICSNRFDSGKKEMAGGYLTEENASRKWLTRLFSAFSFGGYQLGKNNAHIFVHERVSGKLIEEKMPAYIRLGIRMIYQKSGRAADAQMVRRLLHSMTLKQGIKFSSEASRNDILPFIKFHNLNVDEILEPLDSFGNFNDFFYRQLKPNSRPALSTDPNVSLIPADCRLICYPTVDEATQLWIKGSNFSIAGLLKDTTLGEYFDGGSLAICRLAPQDYHRFHCPFEATVNLIYHIPGAYFTVNPMAIRMPLDVLTENARTVVMLESEVFGKVAYVAVGAMMVGSIMMTCEQGQKLNRLDEIGYFAFGGSTIVLVFPPGANQFDQDLLDNSQESLETLVRVGQSLGRRPV